MAHPKIRLTLLKSLSHQLSDIANSARGLGLRRIRQTVVVEDTPSNRGMVNRASHLLKVENV